MDKETIEKYRQAGKIAAQVLDYGKNLIKKNAFLLDVTEKIEAKIFELGAKPAFPVQLSLNHIAAHFCPDEDDKTVFSEQLINLDVGVHVDGYIGDNAVTVDLSGKNEALVKASREALEEALKVIKIGTTLGEIGRTIQEIISEYGFSPVRNLSGHGLGHFKQHEKPSIPNFDTGDKTKIEKGMVFAVEPFATTGEGKVIDGQSSNIFKITTSRNPRNPTARKILEYVSEKYKTLPFSLREMQEKFGPMARLGLKELEQIGAVHNFPQLIEKSRAPVSQAEHTFIKTKDGKIIVTTR